MRDSDRRRGADISPLALLACILSTLIAIPVVWIGRANGESEEVTVEAVAEVSTASALSVELDSNDLFVAGARGGVSDSLQTEKSPRARRFAVVDNGAPLGGSGPSSVGLRDC